MVIIRLDKFNTIAQIQNGEWACNDKIIEHLLQSISEDSGYDPDPDYTAAQAVIKEFGGEITHHDEVEYDPEVIY